MASVPVARHWAVEVSRSFGLDAEAVGNVALLVTELVTNAVVHGRSEFTLELAFEASGPDRGTVHVEVADGDSRLPRMDKADAEALGGRGLALVSSLSDAYGVRELDFGKAVWCELAVEVAATAEVPGGHAREAAEHRARASI